MVKVKLTFTKKEKTILKEIKFTKRDIKNLEKYLVKKTDDYLEAIE